MIRKGGQCKPSLPRTKIKWHSQVRKPKSCRGLPANATRSKIRQKLHFSASKHSPAKERRLGDIQRLQSRVRNSSLGLGFSQAQLPLTYWKAEFMISSDTWRYTEAPNHKNSPSQVVLSGASSITNAIKQADILGIANSGFFKIVLGGIGDFFRSEVILYSIKS